MLELYNLINTSKYNLMLTYDSTASDRRNSQYVDLNGNPTMDEYYNVNGSYYAIEGITSPDGRVLGKMGHSERIGEAVAVNIYGNQDQKIFESGVAYFK